MIKTTKLDHIGVYLADPVKDADWYVKYLGFKITGDFTLPSGHRAIFIVNDAANVTYELVGQPEGSPEYAKFKNGPADIAHVAFAVADVDEAFKQAKADGLDITEGIVDLPEFWSKGYRYFMVKTPTGEIVEFGQQI